VGNVGWGAVGGANVIGVSVIVGGVLGIGAVGMVGVVVCGFNRSFNCTKIIIIIFNKEIEFANIIGYAFNIIADVPKNILAIPSKIRKNKFIFFFA